MSFIYPAFLWALTALSIPIIIHLFQFRRFKRVYFTNVRFLREVKEQTTARNRLKHLLVLLCRLLALAFLVFAFAQPFLPQTANTVAQGSRAVSVYIDNSFSMQARTQNDVQLLDKAKLKAREIANAYGPEDRFQLLTNDFEGKHQRLVGKDEFLANLDEVQLSPNVQTLNKVKMRQQQALNTATSQQHVNKKNLFMVSDFQKNMVDLANDDTTVTFNLVPLTTAAQQNVFIDSVWFEVPVRMLNQPNRLLVRIQNTGNSAVESSKLTLNINQQGKAVKNISVPAKDKIVDTLNFAVTETGWGKAELILQDYPIEFDNNYFFSFEVAPQINLLAINQNNPSVYLNALLKGTDNFVLQNQGVNQIDYTKLPQNQLVILNGLREISSGLAASLQQYLQNGGSVLVFPDANMNTQTYNNFLHPLRTATYGSLNSEPRAVDYINTREAVFSDVFERLNDNIDLPSVQRCFNLNSLANTGEEVLLRLRGGASFLSKFRVGGNGKLYLCATSLDTKDSNLPAHAVFVPMVYKIALLGGKSQRIAYTIGKDEVLETDIRTDKKDAVFKLKSDVEEFIPGQKTLNNKLLLSLNNQLKQAGIYGLSLGEEKPQQFFAFNYNRLESLLDYFTPDELKAQFNQPNVNLFDADGDLSVKVGQADKGIQLWQWCVMLCLLFLLLEILLLRLWRSQVAATKLAA
jgi:hypothetical protein